MKKIGLSLLIAAAMFSSCVENEIVVNSATPVDIDVILEDPDFLELTGMVLQIMEQPKNNTIDDVLELGSVINILNERYMKNNLTGSHEAFRSAFELATGLQSQRQPVRTFSTVCEVPASISRVWQALIDIDAYPDWNPFTPRVETTFEIGSPIVMYVRLFPLFPGQLLRQVEEVVAFEEEVNACWETELISPFFFRSHRCYEVSSSGDEQTLFVNSMVYEGLLAPLVNSMTRQLVLEGFQDASAALKELVE